MFDSIFFGIVYFCVVFITIIGAYKISKDAGKINWDEFSTYLVFALIPVFNVGLMFFILLELSQREDYV